MKRLIYLAVVLVLCAVPGFAQDQSDPGKAVRKERSQWALSASFLLGRFDTNLTNSMLKFMTGFETDLRGRSWDIGAARGRPDNSYFRISYAEVRLANGSSVFDSWETNIIRGVRFRGVKAERVIRLGRSRWPVAPMISVHGGAGKISGRIEQSRKSASFICADGRCWTDENIKTTERPAKELLGGWEWLPIAGFALGATTTIKERYAVTVFVWGMEFPGTFAGGVQFVYWPWGHRY
ncbi:MAG: hypothetical protein V1856_00375 [Candidatus Liptonbacteria bacterium]